MSTDTKIKTLIFNKLTQEQYNNADRVPTEFYLTPDTSIDSSEKGAANGVASLDTNGKLPSGQIPVATTSTIGGVKPDGTTITVTEDGTISVPVSSEVATKADLQDKVSKAGDTMTGLLKMSGANEIRFGTDDNFYYIKHNNSGNFDFNIIKDGKMYGVFLDKQDNYALHYRKDQEFYRLLTTADKGLIVGWGIPDYSAGVTISANTNFTCPADGVIAGEVSAATNGYCNIRINDINVEQVGSESGQRCRGPFYAQVKKGDVVYLFTTGNSEIPLSNFYPYTGVN